MFGEYLEARYFLASPELDLTFGRGGFAPLSEPGLFALRELPGGKIITMGGAIRGPMVTRFNADGSRDTTFDGDGILVVDTWPHRVDDAAFGPDGKIVVLSTSLGVIRFNADGTVDGSFGDAGSVDLGVDATRGVTVAVQPDGRILVAHVGGDPYASTEAYVTRLNVDGSIDDAFRGGTASPLPLPRRLARFSIAVAPSGKIYFVGDEVQSDTVDQTFVGRMNADGTIDNTFSGDGYAQVTDDTVGVVVEDGIAYPPRSRFSRVTVDAQGRPVITSQFFTGEHDASNKVTRFTAGGVRDTSFGGGDGWVELADGDGGPAARATVGPDGKIYATVSAGLIRLNTDGTTDAVVTTPRGLLSSEGLAVDADGNLLVAGATPERVSSFVARFVPDSPVVHLNTEGMLFVDGTDGDDTVTLERSGADVTLRRNGVASTYAAADVKQLSVFGYGGDDTVTLSFALDVEFQGFSGNDTLTVGDGSVTMKGGDGDDRVVAGDGKHLLDLGNGVSVVTVGAGVDTIRTGDGNDTVITGAGSDLVETGDGDDSVITAGGNDTIYAGGGRDEVAAGAGDDTIQGRASGHGFDPGPDPGPPVIEPANDGWLGRKLYFGEAGNDLIIGGSLGSSLSGNDGDDTIYGVAGSDTITGAAGNDFIEAGDGDDRVNGGVGDDEIWGDRQYADFIPLVPGDDLLLGGDGNDTVQGMGGDDTLHGGAGFDVLDGGPGINEIEFPDNLSVLNGVLTFDGTAADETLSIWRDENTGNVVVWFSGSTRSFPAADVSRIELTGNGGNDVLKLNRFLAIPATLDGAAGEDVLLGGSAADVLRGGDGVDYLSAFGGNDYLDGGLNSDALRGGDGKDELDYSSRTGRIIVGLDGLQDDGEDNEGDFASPDIERVRGGSGDDRIGGGPGLSLIYGNDGSDTLGGGGGADGLYGGAGNDQLDGGAGDDYMEGGAGDDVLHGLGGADRLFGLGGNDRFFAAGDGAADVVRGGPGDDRADSDELDDVLAVEETR